MAGYVSLQDVTKTYQMGEITIKAADGISFDVEKGEFVIVVGPSGAGKTTVLNILGEWTQRLQERCWWTARKSANTAARS